MKTRLPSSWRAIFWFVVVAAPLVGIGLRRQRERGCALDGLPIDPRLRVRIVDEDRESHTFCCIQCAVWWLPQHDHQQLRIFVVDEVSANELPADRAHYVRSSVVNQPATGNRIHVFTSREQARAHIVVAGGKILTGSDRPFALETSTR